MPDLVYKIKAKDESESGFQSFTRRVKSMRAEERASGATALERTLRSPEGLLKMAGLGLGGALTQIVVGQVARFTENMEKSITAIRLGKQTVGGAAESMMRGLPFGIGEGWQIGRNIREMITGEEARGEFRNEQYKLSEEFEQNRGAMVKAMIQDRRIMQEKIYQSEALGLTGGMPSANTRIHGMTFAAEQEILAKKEAIEAKYIAAQKDIQGKWSGANAMLHTPFLLRDPFNMSGMDSVARSSMREAEEELAKLNADAKRGFTENEESRRSLLQSQIADFKMDESRRGLASAAGLGGKLGALGTSDKSRTLAYQIQMQQFADSSYKQLDAMGEAGGKGKEILSTYMKLAMSPSNVALATGAGPGPLALPGASGLPSGWTGFAANQQAQWESQRSKMGQEQNAKIEDVLTQLLHWLQMNASNRNYGDINGDN